MRIDDFLHNGTVAPLNPATALRNAVGQHGVLPAAQTEAWVETQSLAAQLPNVEQQIARRRTTNHCPVRSASPRENTHLDNPRIHRLRQIAFDRTGDRGAAPRLPAPHQTRQPFADRDFVVVDEHQRVCITSFRKGLVPRGGDTRTGFVYVPHTVRRPAIDFRPGARLGIVVDHDHHGGRLDTDRLGAECTDCAGQQIRSPKGGHGNDYLRTDTFLLRHRTPPSNWIDSLALAGAMRQFSPMDTFDVTTRGGALQELYHRIPAPADSCLGQNTIHHH
jgi:hypothetical protein